MAAQTRTEAISRPRTAIRRASAILSACGQESGRRDGLLVAGVFH